LVAGTECKACMQDLRKIANKLTWMRIWSVYI
jgi:hypothetical protein